MQVELITGTPGPEEVIEKACRICYDSASNEETRGRFLQSVIKRGHESVLEHASATFKVTGVSRALTHQLVRHRIASYSQRSQRYVKECGFEYVMPQTVASKKEASMAYRVIMERLSDTYRDLLAFGVPAEDARFILPNACCSEIVMTMNFREFRHFIKLRADKHAQWEIRKLAVEICKQLWGIAPDIFDDLYRQFNGEGV